MFCLPLKGTDLLTKRLTLTVPAPLWEQLEKSPNSKESWKCHQSRHNHGATPQLEGIRPTEVEKEPTRIAARSIDGEEKHGKTELMYAKTRRERLP